MAKSIPNNAHGQNPAEPRNESNVKIEFSRELLTELQNNTFSRRCEEDIEIRKEEGLLNDEVSIDEEWEEQEYGNPPKDSFPKPYFEMDKNNHNEKNKNTYKSSDMDDLAETMI
ncbi:hypothetical protein Tco_1422626, partial [Tanacetum coccineum]